MNEQSQQLAELRKRKAEREAERARANAIEEEQREMLELELEEKLEPQYGPRGKGFEILNCEWGVFAVHTGGQAAGALAKAFQASMPGDKTPPPEAVIKYVDPCLAYPDRAKFLSIIGERPYVATRLASLVAKLHGVKEMEDRTKS